MGDVGSQHWLVSPTREIELKWIEVSIQEKKSRIARHKQDIEDLLKGKIIDLEAKIGMLELELRELERGKNNAEIIEVKAS